ncbi:unnamed protein product [Cochlearia groenlandica]
MGRDCHDRFGRDDDGGRTVSSSSKSKRKANVANGGCMAAFYHLFDFQNFYFPSHHNLTIHSPSKSKGLKLIEESSPPSSTTYKEKQSLKLQASILVRTETGTMSSRLRSLTTDTSSSSSDICNSPGSKTPSLVARLMGLDLLPEKLDFHTTTTTRHGSNRFTSHQVSKKATNLGTRSLPESPRISSARKSDFDIHRLSLQLNKEEFGCSRRRSMKQDQEEARSPRDYARQIVKQIKERVVTRRVVGMDITNSVKNREARPLQHSNELRRDTTVSCPPRTRFSDKENKPSNIQKANSLSSLRQEQSTHKTKPKPKTMIVVSISKASGEKQSQKRVKQERDLKPINKCKKSHSEARFTPRLIKHNPTHDIRNNIQEAKANHCNKKRSKKTSQQSNDLIKISTTETPHKEINDTQATKSSEEASTCLSLIRKIDEKTPQVTRTYKSDGGATVSASSSSSTSTLSSVVIDSEREYITKVTKLAGINTDSLVSSATNLDSSIFRELELIGGNRSGSLSLRRDRRMLFDLVNEILIESAKRRSSFHGSEELIGEICDIVERYRHNKLCYVHGEIGSIDVDRLLETKKLEEEEEEEIVAEIERDIVDALVRETVSELCLNSKRRRIQNWAIR